MVSPSSSQGKSTSLPSNHHPGGVIKKGWRGGFKKGEGEGFKRVRGGRVQRGEGGGVQKSQGEGRVQEGGGVQKGVCRERRGGGGKGEGVVRNGWERG